MSKKNQLTLSDIAKELAAANAKIDSLRAKIDLIIAKREERLNDIDLMLDSGDREL